MKNLKNLAIITLMIIFIIILSPKVEATVGKINSETVRVRSEANTKSNILTQLDKNEKIEILEQSEGWYKVTFTKKGEKITGYISEKLVDIEDTNTEETTNTSKDDNKEEQPKEENNEQPVKEEPRTDDISMNIEENKEYTLNKAIKIKVLPNMSSLEKAEISSGNIKTVEIINDWCKVENDSEIGWIRKNILKKSVEGSDTETNPEAPTENTENKDEEQPKTENKKEPEETSANAKVIKTAYVSVESLKVRKENNTSSDIIDSLKKNDEVSIIEKLDGWYKIKIDGKIGYVSSKYISDTKVAETTTSRNTNTQRVEEVTEIQEPTTSSSSAKGGDVVQYAKQYIGYKYVAGGASPSTGFDCSGFTSYVYKQFGIKLNRSSRDQVKNGVAVEKSNLQQGDLVLFNGESNKTIGHVGIYIGGGEFIHASNPKGGVKITPLDSSYYNTRYVGARRVID